MCVCGGVSAAGHLEPEEDGQLGRLPVLEVPQDGAEGRLGHRQQAEAHLGGGEGEPPANKNYTDYDFYYGPYGFVICRRGAPSGQVRDVRCPHARRRAGSRREQVLLIDFGRWMDRTRTGGGPARRAVLRRVTGVARSLQRG